MANTENRYIRIEDWKGNVYYPESNSNSSLGGSVIDSDSASKDATGTGSKTDGEKVSDSTANGGSAIAVTSNSTRQILFSGYFSNVPFGRVSISARMKSSIGSGTMNLIEINTYFVDTSGEEFVETLLDSVNINGNMFGIANEYVGIGMITDYKGVATGSIFLKVEIIVLPDTGATIYFDQLAIAMDLRTSGGSSDLDIHVEDTTIVINTKSGGTATGIYVEDTTVVMNV